MSLTAFAHRIFNHKEYWSKTFYAKISNNSSFSL